MSDPTTILTTQAAAETPEVKESKPKESKKESKTAGSEDPGELIRSI
jgi:hypothetical protein